MKQEEIILSDFPGCHKNADFIGDNSQLWCTWQSTDGMRDHIYLRKSDAGKMNDPMLLSNYNIQAHYKPRIIIDDEAQVNVFWTEIDNLKTKIMRVIVKDDKVLSKSHVTNDSDKAQCPVPFFLSKDEFFLAWEKRTPEGYQIWVKNINSENEALMVSASGSDSHRPVWLQDKDGILWLFWDSYTREKGYEIYYAKIKNGAVIEKDQLTDSDTWNFFACPKLLSDGRIFCSWTNSRDVMNDDGIYAHHTLFQAKIYDGTSWVDCNADNDCIVDIGAIFHDRKHRPTYNRAYFGHMRYGRAIADDKGGILFCWEQSKDFLTHHFRKSSILCGRYFKDNVWHEPVVLTKNTPFFQFAHSGIMKENSIDIVYQDIYERNFPDISYFQLKIKEEDLTNASPFPTETLGLPDEWSYKEYNTIKRKACNEESGYKRLFGDMHLHSHFSSDNEGEIDEILHLAEDIGGLDFIGIADHDELRVDPALQEVFPEVRGGMAMLSYSEYLLPQLQAEIYNEKSVIAIPGYEYTRQWAMTSEFSLKRLNHCVVMYPECGMPIFRSYDPASDTPQKIADRVGECGGMLHYHHERWIPGDQTSMYNAEVVGWDNYIEVCDTVMDFIHKGNKLGFVGGGDDHSYTGGRIGALTVVYAKSETREAVVEALKARRCYATNGPRIKLWFQLNDAIMGEEIVNDGKPLRLKVHAEGTKPLKQIELRLDGKTIKTWTPAANSMEYNIEEMIKAPDGKHNYCIRVIQEGPTHKCAQGNQAWSSPIYLK